MRSSRVVSLVMSGTYCYSVVLMRSSRIVSLMKGTYCYSVVLMRSSRIVNLMKGTYCYSVVLDFTRSSSSAAKG